MMTNLQEAPIAKRPPRTAAGVRVRASASHAPAAREKAKPSPLQVRRVMCESDMALSIALDRMIDDVLRERAEQRQASR